MDRVFGEDYAPGVISPSPILTAKRASPGLASATAAPALSVQSTKQIFMKPPSNYTSHTGVQDWEELVDDLSGRVFFFSESQSLSQWGLPLESVGKTEQERQKLRGWCVHIDPTTQTKYFAHEAKSKAQWNYPGEGLKSVLWRVPYLRDKRSWAIEMQKKHNRAKPSSSLHHIVSANKPSVRTLTLRELIQSLTLDKVVCDREAFKAFQIFASSFHAEENVLFYCVTEAFAKRGSKAVGVLGLDDLAKPHDKGLPRTQSHLNQLVVDQSTAERCKTTVERIQMLREAKGIFNRFLGPEAKDWVFVNPVLVEEVAKVLAECGDDPTATTELNRRLFEKAQAFVFQNLEQDLLPRFIKASLTREREVLSAPIAGTHGAFTPDEVLRHHLLQLQRKPDQVTTSLMSTANAYRSLFPSPRYAIEGREGSGLSPLSLDLLAQDETVVDETSTGKKTFNIVGRMFFPQPKEAPKPQQQVKYQVLLAEPAPAPIAESLSAAKPRVNRLSTVELGGELNLDLETFDVAH